MRAIVIYATCEGQTERIAKRIAEEMANQGVPTAFFSVSLGILSQHVNDRAEVESRRRIRE